MIHKKGNPVPRGWYEILEGEEENPAFTFEFSEDCTETVVDGTRRLTSKSYPVLVINGADGIRINFITPLELHLKEEKC